MAEAGALPRSVTRTSSTGVFQAQPRITISGWEGSSRAGLRGPPSDVQAVQQAVEKNVQHEAQYTFRFAAEQAVEKRSC